MKGKNLDQFFRHENHAYYSKPPLEDLTLLAPCNHEEADSRMLLHISHAATQGHHKILIRTIDTDVIVLAASMVHGLQSGDKLWSAFGTGKSFRYFAAHEIAAGLGPEKARAFPIFHALTGCGNVSSFAGNGKKIAWALLKLSFAPSTILEDMLSHIERFVILIYDRTSTSNDIDATLKKTV